MVRTLFGRVFNRPSAQRGWLVRLSVRLSATDSDRMAGNAIQAALRGVSDAIAETIRPSDTLAVLAPGEFFIVIGERDVPDRAKAVAAVRRLITKASNIGNRLHRPIFPRVNASFIRRSETGRDADAMEPLGLALRQAMMAGDAFAAEASFKSPEAPALIPPDARVEHVLRRALDDGNVFMKFQPIVSLRTGAVASMEALMRIDAPGGGEMQPARFIPIAERSGLIVELGRTALARAADAGRTWREQLGDIAPRRISVNVSATQLDDSGFADDAIALFSAAGMEMLTLELTESARICEAPRALRTLRRLRAAGALVALDDFGVEYSNLAHLRDLPVDILKIDQSFIDQSQEPERGAIILAKAIEMAHALDAQVVAEGVRTSEQISYLRAVGADYGQGEALGEPMMTDEAISFIRQAGQAVPPSAASSSGDMPS